VALPAVKKGTPVTISLRGADGKIVKVQSTKTTKTGTFTLPTLQFKKVGTYTIIAKVGSSTKVITVKVKS
jgi:hypothetical protein